MKTLKYLLITGMFLFMGCKETIYFPDTTPPAPPQGLYTYPGDNFVEIHWTPNTESDLAGYNVYASTSVNGKYRFIATTRQNVFIDNGATNGVTYYYSISAFDINGNESDPSADIAYDTPRPEGYGVRLVNYLANPDKSGYDFSTYSIGPYDDNYSDMFYEYSNGQAYMDVWKDTDIQDMGYTNSLYTIENAPTNGWSPTKDIRLIEGHTYVLWTWNNHYAKFRVMQISPSNVIFDWTYQLQEGNVRLKTAPDRAKLTAGEGFLSRHK
ncbi:MAG: fibronectin type III domain-containing protein [Bacteroidota bacterium]